MKTMKALSIWAGLLFIWSATTAQAQEAAPVASFYSVDESATIELKSGDSQTAQAPLEVTLMANVDNPDNYNYVCEWRIWNTKDNEYSPLVTRFEEDTNYTLTHSGGYGVKLYVTFSLDGDTIEYESEPMTIVISESRLSCPDGFSPNNDGINDYYRVTAQSIVQLDAQFFNRWGQLVHSVSLQNAERADDEANKLVLWDGKSDGKTVKDGVYFINLHATGSDGIEYKVKKAVNILTGYRETTGGSK
ncbi:MAG: gliding motility-associated C-terminal domain-containing protein [Bacteroidaceae bacterium]|nr:gliding motility-associated C-terminal domain-containing protein [Bacteroidaceae bacterium]